MAKFDDDWEFPPEISDAFQAYPQPRLSRGFEARFWNAYEERRGRYQGFTGFLRRLLELEIEGVVVWRLALSTLSGGASCWLVLGILFGLMQPKTAPVQPTPPSQNQQPTPIPTTPLGAFAFYNREWENELLVPQQKPKVTPLKARPQGSDYSWNSNIGSNGHLA